ncbi:MAG: hypothetical protein ACYTEO_17960 [Planctomycetota bacterium]|jgi:hypothetical protein
MMGYTLPKRLKTGQIITQPEWDIMVDNLEFLRDRTEALVPNPIVICGYCGQATLYDRGCRSCGANPNLHADEWERQ